MDIGVAVTKYPGTLRDLVSQNAVTLDELFEWREALINVDGERYLQEVEIIEPEASYRESCQRAVEVTIGNIDSVKSYIQNS